MDFKSYIDFNCLQPLTYNICLTEKKETKVIFNPPATILYMNGKKYVSKAHEEDFDEEKGLLMCIAKANGISHLELKRMIKNAKRPLPPKERKSINGVSVKIERLELAEK